MDKLDVFWVNRVPTQTFFENLLFIVYLLYFAILIMTIHFNLSIVSVQEF